MAGKIAIMETVLRDAHQCLVATRMRTEDMLPIAAELDDVGYWSLETWGGATFDATLRYLNEDPWERLRKLRAAMPKTRSRCSCAGRTSSVTATILTTSCRHSWPVPRRTASTSFASSTP